MKRKFHKKKFKKKNRENVKKKYGIFLRKNRENVFYFTFFWQKNRENVKKNTGIIFTEKS